MTIVNVLRKEGIAYASYASDFLNNEYGIFRIVY